MRRPVAFLDIALTRRGALRVIALASVGLVAACQSAGSSAQPTAGPQPAGAAATSSGWSQVIEAAKKEGTVTYYSASPKDSEQPLLKKFEDQYGISVQGDYSGGGEAILRKVETELSANQNIADVLGFADQATAAYFKRKGILAAFTTPAEANLPKKLLDPDQQIHSILTQGVPIIFNKTLIQDPTPFKSYKDLADPKWKGNLVIGRPENSGVITMAVIGWSHLYGMDFFQQLKANQLAEAQRGVEAVQQVARGEKGVSVLGVQGAYPLLAQGAPIAFAWTEPVFTSESTAVVLKNAPHPNAARLLTDFFWSEYYQSERASKNALSPLVPGVKGPEGIPSLESLKVEPVDASLVLDKKDEVIAKWRDIMK